MATKTQSLTVPARDKAHEDCHCGCAPCDGSCCRLDCIVQPRFFCGQLLTDADLSALLKWARDRFGLSRYRHGWGVVCGLDVRCQAGSPTGIIVTPGYAVDCCGNDIIVCEDASLDLKRACREEADPCADLRQQFEVPGEELGFKDRLRVVDIYLNYNETLSDPSTAMGRSSCKQVAECEYSRTRETYKLSYELGVVGSDPVRARATKWHEGYEKCVEVLKKFRAQFPANPPPADANPPAADVRRWLLRWIDDHPQYSLCFLRERLCREEDRFFTQENIVLVLAAFVQICRNVYLNCDCFGCDENSRVPLARVWLSPGDRATGEACRIVTIDPYPPFRRPIQPECWPAPLGSVNVGRFIWHRWDEVCPAAADLGLNVERVDIQPPQTLDHLERLLDCDLFVECGEKRVALVFNADILGDRVIGFCATAPEPEPEPAPEPGLCPEITVRSTPNVGENVIEFSAFLTGGPTALNPTFNWTVPDREITSGQGTARIMVDVASFNGTVSATIVVGGLDASCNNRATATVDVGRLRGQLSQGDDFTLIPDIKEARAGTLKDAGIRTFAELAKTSVEKLREHFPVGIVTDDMLRKWIQEAKKRAGL